MHYVQQPKDSNLCGQAVVAMLADISLSEAIAQMGGKSTHTKDIVDALRCHGFKVPDRRRPSHGKPLPNNCVVFARVPFRKSVGHWMLMWGGRLYDPAEHYNQGGYIVTSYIPILEAP